MTTKPHSIDTVKKILDAPKATIGKKTEQLNDQAVKWHQESTRAGRLGFFGSRTLTDNQVKAEIYAAIAKHKPSVIVTAGEPGGVCRLAQEVAREKGIPTAIHWLNFKYLRGAFEHRSKAVILDCEHLIILHDGISKGTANELTLAKKMRRDYTYKQMAPSPDLPENEEDEDDPNKF